MRKYVEENKRKKMEMGVLMLKRQVLSFSFWSVCFGSSKSEGEWGVVGGPGEKPKGIKLTEEH